MPQTGYTPIQIYSSSTPTNAPSAGNLTNDTKGSELAINIADKNLFFKDSSNVVNTVPIRQSGAASDGWLSSTDWNTFNNKQPAGTYVTSVSGTAPVVSSGGTTPAISMAAATTSVNGYLTSTDWNTFNGKQAALVSGTNIKTVSGTTLLGSGDLGTIGVGYGGTGTSTAFTAGSVVFAGASGVYSQDNANLFWDDANNRLGIGIATPQASLEVIGSGFSSIFRTNSGTSANNSGIIFNLVSSATAANRVAGIVLDPNGANGTGGDYGYIAADGSGNLKFSNQGSEVMRLFSSTGVSIGNTTDPGNTNLFVAGTGKFGTTVGVGAATPAASGAGITFPATQSASSNANTLDDYEEGTWTPVATSSGTQPTLTYQTQEGYYTKIGDTVYCRLAFKFTVTVGGTGSLMVSLPFTAVNAGSFYQHSACGYSDAAGAESIYQIGVMINAATATLYTSLAAGATNAATTGFRAFAINFFYKV